MKRTLFLAALVTALLLGAAVYATATDSYTYHGTAVAPASDATGTVTVTATVDPKIDLTIETPNDNQTVGFGTVYPGDVIPSETVTLSVDSNMNYSLGMTPSGDTALLGLTHPGSAPNGTWGQLGDTGEYYDVYKIAPPWNTPPATYEAYVQYTVTQL